MSDNKRLADMFHELADALEFLGENFFKIAAYRKVSRLLESFPGDIREYYEKNGYDGLVKIPGIGENIAKKMEDYFKTGSFKKYDEIKKKVPDTILKMLNIQGVGPKTLRIAYDKLGVRDLSDLVEVATDGRLQALRGMGKKKVENILKSIELFGKLQERIPIGLVYPIVKRLRKIFLSDKRVSEFEVCGSFRRKKETVGDIDILCISDRSGEVIRDFVNLEGVTRVLAEGETKGSVVMENMIQVDLRVVDAESFGAALQYFTGSKEHNVHLRTLARKRNIRISEYGAFKNGKKIAGRNENEIYEIMGMDYIPPCLREDRGEIEAALSGNLPRLIKLEDIKGDLHVHSLYSDGTASLQQIAVKAMEMGYDYVAVCDHSKAAYYANGLRIDRLKERNREIDNVNEELGKKILLKGTEVDILPDGSLDYPDEVLAELDFVVASIHRWKKQEDTTHRILKALENPYVDTIAHPTGRLISKRQGYMVDLDKVLHRVSETGKAIEINAYYDRLDLNDIWAKRAKELGARITIGSDSHQIEQLWMMELGVFVARRGWLEAQHVLNTLTLAELLKRRAERIRQYS